MMKAIILAAGMGSRLRPITNEKPKTMVCVNNKPILGYILDALIEAKINDIIVCTGYLAEKITNFTDEYYKNKANITILTNERFETTNNMYSLYLARKYLDDEVMIMNADIVFDPIIVNDLKRQMGSLAKGMFLW